MNKKLNAKRAENIFLKFSTMCTRLLKQEKNIVLTDTWKFKDSQIAIFTPTVETVYDVSFVWY